MELRLLEETKRTIRIEVANPDDTILYPLINELLREEGVSDARYITGHPLLDKPSILVKLTAGDPREVLKKVARNLAGQYGRMKKKIEETPEPPKG